MSEKLGFWQRAWSLADNLPLWAKCLVMPLLTLCIFGYALVMISAVLLSMPLVFAYFAIEGGIGYRKRVQRLRSEGRVVSAEDAVRCVLGESGWLIVAETIKGQLGEVWLYRDGPRSNCVAGLPSLSARDDWGWPDENKDRRWDFYGPYQESIINVEEFLLDCASGEGKLVVGGRRSLERIFDHPRVKVTFQG